MRVIKYEKAITQTEAACVQQLSNNKKKNTMDHYIRDGQQICWRKSARIQRFVQNVRV